MMAQLLIPIILDTVCQGPLSDAISYWIHRRVTERAFAPLRTFTAGATLAGLDIGAWS